MELSSVYSLYHSYFYSDVEREQTRGTTIPLQKSSRKGDTISLSEEAASLASAMSFQKTVTEESSTNPDTLSEDGAESGSSRTSRKSAGFAFSYSSATHSDINAEIQRIEKEVKELNETLMQVLSGTQPIGIKLRMSDPIQKRLQDCVQELQNLRAHVEGMKSEKREAA